MLKAPLSTGALVPSSRYLAAAMARAAGPCAHLVELGAGTGPVTQALRTHHAEASLVAVELQHNLVTHLRARFPSVDIREACAHEVLDSLQYAGPTALVSSLPFRSLPAEVTQTTVASIVAFLQRHPGARLVQFTYQPRAPFPAPEGFHWQRAGTVWRNTPPAGVWVLRAVSQA